MDESLNGAPASGPDQTPSLATEVPGALLGRVVVAIGADLVDIDRIRQTVARTPRFVERVFTEDERRYCDLRRDPAERYAARFAAKEAVLKALGTGLAGAAMREIEVVKGPQGKPGLVLRGRAQALAAELGIEQWLITVTHSDHLAQVFVAGLAEPVDTAEAGETAEPGDRGGGDGGGGR